MLSRPVSAGAPPAFSPVFGHGLKPVPGNKDAAGRGAEAPLYHRRYFVPSERAKDFALIFPEARFEVTPPELPSNTAPRDDALLAMVTGWMMHCGPVTSGALAYWLGLSVAEVEQALLRMEASGSALTPHS